MQRKTFFRPFCSNNQLAAAGAEELVNGDWPELQQLEIR